METQKILENEPSEEETSQESQQTDVQMSVVAATFREELFLTDIFWGSRRIS
jgi:hypothetical protein